MLNKIDARRFFFFLSDYALRVYDPQKVLRQKHSYAHPLSLRDFACPAFRVHIYQQDIERWGAASGRYSQSPIRPFSSTGAIVSLDNDEMT